jgi:hypothetical protein
MAIRHLNEDQYLEELNDKLRTHPDFKPGMRFMPWPEGATGAAVRGITWDGGEIMDTRIFAEVSMRVADEVRFEPTPRR